MREYIRGNPDPRVADAKDHLTVLFGSADRDVPSGRRVLGGVREQIRGDLTSRVASPRIGRPLLGT